MNEAHPFPYPYQNGSEQIETHQRWNEPQDTCSSAYEPCMVKGNKICVPNACPLVITYVKYLEERANYEKEYAPWQKTRKTSTIETDDGRDFLTDHKSPAQHEKWGQAHA